MTAYIALVRAVNVGGTGKLPMTELKAMCVAEGYTNVQTYIASGNVIFRTKASPRTVKAALERRLAAYAGKPVGVIIRTASELAAVLAANPFPHATGNRCVAVFLDQPPSPNALAEVRGRRGEEIHIGAREIYIHYGDGMASSKLVIPAAKLGTARNMNTIAALAAMAVSE